jgi:hypothetical protein
MGRLVLILVIVVAGCRPPGYGDDDEPTVDAAPGGPDAGPGGDAAPADAAPTGDAAACTAGFSLSGHDTATSVWLSGDFVGWAGTPATGALELARGVDGVWRVNHGFAPGSYQYKFIIDGATWIPDPGNADTVPDGLGGVNSVFTCP